MREVASLESRRVRVVRGANVQVEVTERGEARF